MDFETAPTIWNKDHRISIGEKSDENHSPFLVDSSGYNEKLEGCLKGLDRGHCKEKEKLGNATEGVREQARVEKPAGKNLGETAATKF